MAVATAGSVVVGSMVVAMALALAMAQRIVVEIVGAMPVKNAIVVLAIVAHDQYE